MITIRLSAADRNLAIHHGKAAAIGGRSHVREDADRHKQLLEDQMVGQLGTVALHRYWFGDVTRYVTGRMYQNRNPQQGDGGEDIPGCNVDVKTSRMRSSQNVLEYNLLVRPKERHEGWLYIAAFIGANFAVDQLVLLAGWASDAQLGTVPETSGPFEGAFKVPVLHLNPMMPVCFEYLG